MAQKISRWEDLKKKSKLSPERLAIVEALAQEKALELTRKKIKERDWINDAQELLKMGAKMIDSETVEHLLEKIRYLENEIDYLHSCKNDIENELNDVKNKLNDVKNELCEVTGKFF